MSTAQVFFCRAPARPFTVAWWIATLTRSPLVHVAIGYGGAVLNPGLPGDTFWAVAEFAELYPLIAFCVEVPVDRPLDLDQGADTAPRRIWPTVLRWLLGGRLATRDCVAVASRHLRAGGCRVPDSVVTPQDLFDHLTAQHYATTVFDGL